MKRKNMHQFYIYKKISLKIDGESLIKWQYKESFYLNNQQDINELDKTASGVVDYDTLKLRIRKNIDIDKTDGISSIKLDMDENYIVINNQKPQYVVESTNIIGKSHLFICKTYNGE